MLTAALVCCAASLIFSIFAVWFAARAAKIAANRISFPSRTVAELTARLGAVEASIDETGAALTVVANKVKMQRVRTAAAHTDPQSDPTTADKDALRRKAGLVAGQPARHN